MKGRLLFGICGAAALGSMSCSSANGTPSYTGGKSTSTGQNDASIADVTAPDQASGQEPEAAPAEAAPADAAGETDGPAQPSPDALADTAAEAPESSSTDAAFDTANDTSEGGCFVPATPGQCTVPADINCPVPKLSLTGCMDPNNPTQFASLVMPYEVNSPLWSDSAYKARGLVLPAGGKIHVKNCTADPSECPAGPADTGKWVMPVGTVMVKSFMFDNKLVETRLLVHTDPYNWYGFSYAWDEAQTDATIEPNAETAVMFDTATDAGIVDWHYPSRDDCTTCHTQQAGGTLGLETDQMNRVVGGVNQIDQLQAMGLFDAPVPTPYETALVIPYPGQLGSPPPTATLDQRARSYLHANCANCHRPDADFNVFDLRYDVSLQDTGACDTPPTMGNLGVTGAVDIDPGMPMLSLIWLRMDAPFNLTPPVHMPRLATYQFDTQGLQLISDWITSIPACP